jgi:hypothetical protein
VAAVAETGRLPAGLTFRAHRNGTATLAGTPARREAGKRFTIKIVASNGTGKATQELTIVIVSEDDPGRRPVIECSGCGPTSLTAGRRQASGAALANVADASYSAVTTVAKAPLPGGWLWPMIRNGRHSARYARYVRLMRWPGGSGRRRTDGVGNGGARRAISGKSRGGDGWT